MGRERDFLAKVNRGVLSICWAVAALVDITIVAEYFKGGRTLLEVMFFFILVQATMITSTLIIRRNPSSLVPRTVIFIGFFLAWGMIFLSSKFLITFAFVFPFVTTYSLYSDKVYILKISAAVLGLNIVKVVKEVLAGHASAYDTTNYMIQIVMVVLFLTAIYVAASVTHGLRKDSAASMQQVEEAHREQEQMLNDILNIAKVLDKNSQEVYAIVKEIASSSEEVSNTIAEINRGMTDNTRSIQNQSNFAGEIQKEIVKTMELSQAMDDASNETEIVVNRGQNLINQLNIKAEAMDENNAHVYNAINSLKEKSNDIVKITEAITGIANQTNLLALNAAIEAARVGEAGQGFAVVASEIRNLAEQSRISANTISGIINKLQEDTLKSVAAVANLKDVYNEQSGLVQETSRVFTEINQNTLEVREKIRLVNERIKEILRANEKIGEAIANISKVSGATSANAEAATTIAEDHINQAESAKKLVTELIRTSEDMRKYIG